MDTIESIAIIAPIATTAVSGVVGWFAGRRKRNNDALATMQKTIDDLAAKNAEYLAEITTLRSQVADLAADNTKLQHGQAEMQAKLDEIGKENAALRTIIESRTIPQKTKRNGTL